MRRRMSPRESPSCTGWRGAVGRWARLGAGVAPGASWGLGGGIAVAGEVEEPLVLLVGLVEHGGQAGDMLPVVAFPFLIEPGLFPFAVLHQADLFTQDVYDIGCRRL